MLVYSCSLGKQGGRLLHVAGKATQKFGTLRCLDQCGDEHVVGVRLIKVAIGFLIGFLMRSAPAGRSNEFTATSSSSDTGDLTDMDGVANSCRTKSRLYAWGLYRIPAHTSQTIGHIAMRDYPHGAVICQIHATQSQHSTGLQNVEWDIEAARKDVMCASKQQGGAEGACRRMRAVGIRWMQG